jgi:cytochrome c2
VEGYAYSSALREAKGNWTDARIHAFLSNPQREFPGTNMSGTTIHFNDIWAVIGYLKNPN